MVPAQVGEGKLISVPPQEAVLYQRQNGKVALTAVYAISQQDKVQLPRVCGSRMAYDVQQGFKFSVYITDDAVGAVRFCGNDSACAVIQPNSPADKCLGNGHLCAKIRVALIQLFPYRRVAVPPHGACLVNAYAAC